MYLFMLHPEARSHHEKRKATFGFFSLLKIYQKTFIYISQNASSKQL